jgi:hypothetical protein
MQYLLSALLSQNLLTESNPKEVEAEAGATQPSFRLTPYSTKEVASIDEHIGLSMKTKFQFDFKERRA